MAYPQLTAKAGALATALAIRTRKLSLVEAVDAAITRAGQHDAEIDAIAVPDFTRACETAKAMDAEMKKFIEENVPYLKDKIVKAVPNTASALLDERFNEDELKQILAWAESPVSQKFGMASMELQKAIAQKVMTEAGPTLEGRLKTLQGNLAKQLGLQPPAAPAKPPASAPKKP